MEKMEKERIIKSMENAKYMLVVTNNTTVAEGTLAEIMAMITSAIEDLAKNSPLTEKEILEKIKDALKIKKEYDKKMEDNSSRINKTLEKINVMKKFLEELKKYE